ncbi:hypothetical protein Kpol_457p4 [Vanderwaltozyma polyspora DSM 70294]|uniref:Glycosyltransferase family 15 protein n=1 Tax=Vanderwaltozyma polyspora (strain ATCC 22028 / DSM 70294 / BCRC 21397 / CBS 2163 / NBRC 10782 / NRRL Y-8283 / UCD 57-17) TaxID=436907 RepID=A7TQU5_VANPO|nr:uncharacterized protein Kpol_457p4 [Vanderwaltozyma polyspora DSM 70294]EDO15353.1 hypothetical protein Kpol_457p4 [Vanderwaltozyma polyspora DSM 70294]
MSEEDTKTKKVDQRSNNGTNYKFSLISILIAIVSIFVIYYKQNSNLTIDENTCGEICNNVNKGIDSTVVTTETVTTEKIITSVITEAGPVVTKVITEENNVKRSTEQQDDNDDIVYLDLEGTSKMINLIRPDDYQMPASDVAQGVVHPEDDGIRENAVLVTLCRNSDLLNLQKTIRDIEDRFNHRYHYDWVFLNEVEFSDEFKRVTSALCSGKTKYGLIPEEQWSEPDYIDVEKFEKIRDEMFDNEVLYGESIPYRHMCRYQAGFFWQHPLLDEYDYYWRVDSDVNIFCNIPYDIFKFMRVNQKKYGFILSLTEYETTIPTLWKHVKGFLDEHPEYINDNNLIDFISDDDGETFNGCHFWSNFEVADLNFFRSQAYQDFFEYLDNTGNFFYERWGDAPIHSIAAAFFLDRSEFHFFDGLGFYHPDFLSCPTEENIRIQNQCTCDPEKDVTWWTFYFCTRQYFRINDYELPPDVSPI